MRAFFFLFSFLSLTVYAAQTVSSSDPSRLAASLPPFSSNPPAYMVIDLAQRAQDFKQAFELLRKEKTTGKVFFQLQDGSTISNIIDMTLMTNSSLILFRFNSLQGIRFQLIKVEEILAISY